MFNNFNLIFFLVFLFPLLSFFYVDNLFLLWIVIEIQTLFFLVYMWNTVHNTNNLLYFLVIQIFCSGVLFFLIYVFTLSVEVFYLELLFQLVLFLNIGIFPFHGWALWFCETVPYSTFFLFLTGMKFLPLLLLIENNNHSYIWLFILNIFFSSILVFFSLSYISILFFSSIFISSLLMFIGFLSSLDVLFLLFLTYTFLIFLLIFSMPFFSISILDIASNNLSIFLFVLVISIVGIPFSVGFLLNVLFLQVINENLGIVLSFVLIFFTSVILSYFYINILYIYFMLGTMREILTLFSSCRANSFNFFFLVCSCFLVIFLMFINHSLFF